MTRFLSAVALFLGAAVIGFIVVYAAMTGVPR